MIKKGMWSLKLPTASLVLIPAAVGINYIGKSVAGVIASIMAMKTDILIIDEPTIAQDYAGKERIKKIMNELKSLGKLVL